MELDKAQSKGVSFFVISYTVKLLAQIATTNMFGHYNQSLSLSTTTARRCRRRRWRRFFYFSFRPCSKKPAMQKTTLPKLLSGGAVGFERLFVGPCLLLLAGAKELSNTELLLLLLLLPTTTIGPWHFCS